MNTKRNLFNSLPLFLSILLVAFIFIYPNEFVGHTLGHVVKSQISDLNDFSQFREQFEKETGKVRLISLLSPT